MRFRFIFWSKTVHNIELRTETVLNSTWISYERFIDGWIYWRHVSWRARNKSTKLTRRWLLPEINAWSSFVTISIFLQISASDKTDFIRPSNKYLQKEATLQRRMQRHNSYAVYDHT